MFKESERRIFTFDSDVTVSYLNDRNEEDIADNSIVQKEKNFSNEIDITTNIREYFDPNTFLLIRENLSLTYAYEKSEGRDNGSTSELEKRYDRSFSSGTRIGIGIGRVRNVNPVIRSVRLSERYEEIAGGRQFGREYVQSIANAFTKYQGYQRRYDRPEKHFWQSVDEAAGNSLSELNSFDLLYLTDVLDEAIGNRLQGWDASVGGVFLYSNFLNRIENPLNPAGSEVNRLLTINKSAGPFVEARWYKNLSLEHQLGVIIDSGLFYSIDSDHSLLWDANVSLQGSWMWNLADRFLLRTNLYNAYAAQKFKEDTIDPEYRQWTNTSGVTSNLVFFVENRIALNAGFSYFLRYIGDTNSEFSFDNRDSIFSFDAGLRYYFSRNLY